MPASNASATTVAPVFDREAVTVVFATDENYAPYAAAAVSSVIAAASPGRCYDLVILETGLTDDDRGKIRSLASGRANVSLRFFDAAPVVAAKADLLFVDAHLSPATYYRLFSPSVFEVYDKILYLDVDLIALGDVGELYSVDLGDNLLGAVRDFFAVKDLLADSGGAWARQLSLRDFTHYFNAGVLLLNLKKMRSENFEQIWIDYLRRVKRPRLHDQDILNACCEGRVKYLDAAWNCQAWNGKLFGEPDPEVPSARLYDEYSAAAKDPRIIHYLSSHKPWHLPQVPLAEHFWGHAARTPYYNKLVFDNLRKLNADCRALQSRLGFPPPALKRLFYSLLSRLGTKAGRRRYQDKLKKLKARRRSGW